jgi:hypothetical protein
MNVTAAREFPGREGGGCAAGWNRTASFPILASEGEEVWASAMTDMRWCQSMWGAEES